MYKILSSILKKLALPVIKQRRPKIIGVTGSVGKTSTKEAIFYLLNNSKEYQGKIEKSYGGLNTEVGLPLSILGFHKPAAGFGWLILIFKAYLRSIKLRSSKIYPKILVLEYAADKPGDIEYLTNIARPNIAVITEIGPAHLLNFKTVENIAKEKIKLAQKLEADGVAVLNENNKYLKEYAKHIYFDKVWYDGNSFDSAKNAAKAVGKIMNLQPKEIDEILNDLPGVPGRLQEFEGIKNTVIIDDSYNSNPLSCARALFILKKKRTNGKKIAILGDMRELGQSSPEEHKKIAKKILKNADLAILIGPDMQQYAAPVLKNNNFKYYAFETFTKAKEAIIKNIDQNDVILIKGSQNELFLERVTQMLLAHKEDESRLCRQSQFWYNIKNKTP